MKILALLMLFAFPVLADGPDQTPTPPTDKKPVEDLTLKCYKDGLPMKFTGRTRFDGYECEFQHSYQGHRHTMFYSCRDARKINGKL